ncbi:MAG: MalY/PatB family protein [Bacteroidota bacterium]
MRYHFDEIVDRRGTDCIKYDALPQFFGSDDVLPLWVADMDFRTPDFIMDAIRKRMEHEILGYTYRGDDFSGSITGWVGRRFNWNVKKEWISFSPGVVSAITVSVMAYTKPGDKVIVQTPVYFPFFESVRGMGRRLVENPLRLADGRYHFDFDDLESKIDEKTKMLILCSPHNPGGMVWKREELGRLAGICNRHNLIVVSDEIHSDLLFDDQVHTPYAMISEECAMNSVVCMAPSKTFNVAGLSTSFVVIPDPEKMKAYEKLMRTLHVHMGNIAGTVALMAAYQHGEQWLGEMMRYVQDNYDYLEKVLSDRLPDVGVMKPEATYLVWLDFRHYGMNDRQLSRFLVEKAKVGLNNGGRFGKPGDGFMRINIGCPREILSEALERICVAFGEI